MNSCAMSTGLHQPTLAMPESAAEGLMRHSLNEWANRASLSKDHTTGDYAGRGSKNLRQVQYTYVLCKLS